MTTEMEIVSKIETTIEEMKKDNTDVMAAIKVATDANGKDVKDALAKAEALATKIQANADQIVELEQKLSDKVVSGTAAAESLGRMVIKSDSYKEFAKGNATKMNVFANTITGQDGSPPANSDILVAPQYVPGIIPGAFRALRVADVLPQGTTISNAINYARELLFTNNAAETAEAAQIPESVLTFEQVTAPVVSIATFLKVTNQVLDDAPMLRSYIDGRLRHAVLNRFDAQLLNGNGIGQNISGITNTGNFTAFTPVTGENALDGINRAIAAVRTADYEPTAIMMSPTDWAAIERIKVGSSDVRYVVGDPTAVMGPRLWGLPVVVTNQMALGKFVVGAMDIAFQVWTLQGVEVQMFEQDEDNVQKISLTIRAVTRAALAALRPASVRYGDLVV